VRGTRGPEVGLLETSAAVYPAAELVPVGGAILVGVRGQLDLGMDPVRHVAQKVRDEVLPNEPLAGVACLKSVCVMVRDNEAGRLLRRWCFVLVMVLDFGR
jgi:hypothetical protein